MAPRANWKGFLRLSLVTCPIALFPATSESEKISFNQINKKTGHRIKYQKVDADTGEEVASDDIISALILSATAILLCGLPVEIRLHVGPVVSARLAHNRFDIR
jgi:DNA end-binding protein Ku